MSPPMRIWGTYTNRALLLAVVTLAVVFGAASRLGANPIASAQASTTDQNARATQTTTPVVNPVHDQKRECAYTADSVSELSQFSSLVGRSMIDCALVFDASPDWSGWTDPYFLHDTTADLDWGSWVRESPSNDRRQLVISQPMIPTDLSSTDWRAAGAAGDFDGYAVQFAQNLVADGVGDAIIRLGWEANGTSGIDNIGTTPQDFANWVQTWRNIVISMRSVAGAHFQFDWTVNNCYRSIPLSEYYPGDDVVNIIGDDAYDEGVPTGDTNRWGYIDGCAAGLGTVASFAQAHDKELSLPEWGVGPTGSGSTAGGDDPAYVNDIASFVQNNDVAYQSYFFNQAWATELEHGPQSLAAYHQAFGDGGDALGTDNGTALATTSGVITTGVPATSPAPASPTAAPAADGAGGTVASAPATGSVAPIATGTSSAASSGGGGAATPTRARSSTASRGGTAASVGRSRHEKYADRKRGIAEGKRVTTAKKARQSARGYYSEK
jgi:hypothetical protein